MRIKSAVDWWLAALIGIIIGMMVFAMITAPASEVALVCLISLPTIGFMLWIYFATYYELREELLYCRCGPFVARIPYDAIKTIRLSRNPISSLALSTKRIEIVHASKSFFGGLTYISPPDREDFMGQLLAKCPQVRLDKEGTGRRKTKS